MTAGLKRMYRRRGISEDSVCPASVGYKDMTKASRYTACLLAAAVLTCMPNLASSYMLPSIVNTNSLQSRRLNDFSARRILRAMPPNIDEDEPPQSSKTVPSLFGSPTNGLVDNAQRLWQVQKMASTTQASGAAGGATTRDHTPMSRRMLFGAGLIGTSAMLGADEAGATLAETTANFGKLAWEATPVNKRTGVTVFDAESAGYNVQFVTYLARFLLVFDNDCQRWWYARATDIPRTATLEQVEETRLSQFGAFSASVEVGLQEYRSNPAKLMQSLLARYCPDIDTVRAKRSERGLPALSPQQEEAERREIKEARRQIALLFGLMEVNQPTDDLTLLLAAIDNGSVSSVTIQQPGSGYAPGYGSPLVEFPPPTAQGKEYERATGRARLEPSGKILRIDLMDRGNGYNPSKPPIITISSPLNGTVVATAKANVFKNGLNKGKLASIVLQDAGDGYSADTPIKVSVAPPEYDTSNGNKPQWGGVEATAVAVLEYQVAGIDITNQGSGYAIEKPVEVKVDAPPLTARVNMNDPFIARIIDPTKPLPSSTIPTSQMKKRMPDITDPSSAAYVAEQMAKMGGGGGCIGRACYDQPVIAYATAVAETSSFSAFRKESEAMRPLERQAAIESAVLGEEITVGPKRVISAVASSPDRMSSGTFPTPFWSSGSRAGSSQFLALLPAGLGLEYDASLKRYALTATDDFADRNAQWVASNSKRPLDPEFGPRGRSPIEREVQLDTSSYLRFCISGAICCSGVHLVVTPIDVVKTKIQTDPEKYPGAISGFRNLLKERGFGGFFAGWVPTSLGWFVWGGFTYSLTEFLRRIFTAELGPSAGAFEVPIVLTASAIGAFFGVFLLCPFEAVRIRSVSQPDYAPNPIAITKRMVSEEGLSSLFNAIPPLLLKEIPFAMAKFSTFAVATRLLFEAFPAAQEDVRLSLLVSLAGGAIGGMTAAIVSNPGDATVSEMKKSKTELSASEAAKGLIEQGGLQNLMRGLPLRMAFYPLVVSLQFLVYDSVRLSLGIGSDDLKVYLDVLGGALSDGGGMVGPM